MESVDDGFGDLYTDLEAQENPTINGVPDFAKLYVEPEYGTKNDRILARSPKKDLVLHSKERSSETEESTQSTDDDLTQEAASLEADESDSDDDLTILLNDEDCKMFGVSAGACSRYVGHEEDQNGYFGACAEGNKPGENWKLGDGLELNSSGHGGERGKCVKGGYSSQYKYIRSHGSAISSNVRVNGSMEVASLSSMSARDDLEDSRSSQFKSSISNQVSDTCHNPSSVAHQCGYGFLPPWYRTILNIDIDALKEKPWRCPGADITDFFNFGFDEQSWKEYCNSLASRVGDENEKAGQASANNNTQGELCSRFVDERVRTSGLPRGRAIQIEDTVGDRQPSMGIRRPRNQDSDVVIQIPLQDFTIDSFGLSKEEHIGCSIQDTSRNGNLRVDDDKSIHFSSGGSGDEFDAESLEEDIRTLDVSSSLRRCSEPMIASNQMSSDTCNQEHATISVMDHPNHLNINSFCSKITRARKAADKEEKRVNINAGNFDPCQIEKELSAGDQSPLGLTPSCFESDSEASKDSVHDDHMKIHCSGQSSPELQESDSLHYKNYARNDIKTRTENGEEHLGHRNSFQGKKKHGGKFKSAAKSKVYPENDDDSLLIPKRKGDSRSCLRHKSPIQFREERTHCNGRSCPDFEQKIHAKNADNVNASPISKSDVGLYARDDTSIDEGRWNARLSDYIEKEDFSYYKERGVHGGGSERFAEKHACTVYSRYSRRNSHQIFKDDLDQYVRRNCNKKGYCSERRTNVDNGGYVNRARYYSRRGYTNGDMSPCSSREYRSLPSKYSSDHKGRDAQWGMENEKLQFRMKTECEHKDESHRDKYASSISFTDWMRDDTFVGAYEGDFPVFERELEFSGGRDRCCNAPRLLLDRYSKGTRTRNADCRFFSSQSLGKAYPVKGVRHGIRGVHRNDVKNFNTIEAHDRRWRKIHEDEGRNGWFDRFNDTEEIENSLMCKQHEVNLGRRQYSWKSRVFQCTKDKFVVSHQGDEFVTNEALLPLEEVLMHDRIYSKHGYVEDEKHIDDIELEHHRYKVIKRGNYSQSSSRSMGIYEHEQSIMRCKDPVNLVLGEVEFPRRFPKGRKILWNDRVENMDTKFMKHQRTSRVSNELQIEEDLTNIELKMSDARWPSKHLVAEEDKDLDIEEGQIIVEEPNMVVYSQTKSACETAAQIRYVKERTNYPENDSGKNEVKIDEQRILETMAKMEKRRERFKESMSVKKELATHLAQAKQVPDTTVNEQQRPARKRRWCGS